MTARATWCSRAHITPAGGRGSMRARRSPYVPPTAAFRRFASTVRELTGSRISVSADENRTVGLDLDPVGERGAGRAGRGDSVVFAQGCLQIGHGLSFASSPPIVSMSEAISRSLKSNRMPAAANSSGSGREPPSASAFL